MGTGPEQVIELTIDIDYGQVYIYGVPPWEHPDPEPDPSTCLERALDDAYSSGRRLGVDSGLIDLLSPAKMHFDAPMRLELWGQAPDDDCASWDQVVDVDLDLPTGEIRFQRSGDTVVGARADVPPGRYRARIAGRGYDEVQASDAVECGADSYRIQLWPRTADSEPELVKAWNSWAE